MHEHFSDARCDPNISRRCSAVPLDKSRGWAYGNAMVHDAIYQHTSWFANAIYPARAVCTRKQICWVWLFTRCIPIKDWHWHGYILFSDLRHNLHDLAGNTYHWGVSWASWHILLYKRFLDDIFMIWSGLSAELYRLQANFELVNNPAIKSLITLEWQGMPSAGGTADPAVFDWTKHSRVDFLDLDIKAVYTTTPNGGVRVWRIQETWERLRVSPVLLTSLKERLSWMAQSRNAQAAHTLKQHKYLAWGVS